MLTLHRYGDACGIGVHGVELMPTRRYHSEERLAERGWASLPERRGGRVLFGSGRCGVRRCGSR